MAHFFRTLAATVFFMLVVEICCWPCPPKMRRDMDGKRGVYPTRYRCRCGTVLYDPGSELCCNNNRYPKHRGHLCCGNRTYNCFSQKCCRYGFFTMVITRFRGRCPIR